MATYNHKCEEHGGFEVFTKSWSEYEELQEIYGRDEHGSLTVPCPECGGVAPRDYTRGVAYGQVKGGALYAQEGYRRGAEQNWLRNEVKNTKEVLEFKKGISPYGNYTVKDGVDPESMGMRKVTQDEAKGRSEAAKKGSGEKKDKVDHARKR